MAAHPTTRLVAFAHVARHGTLTKAAQAMGVTTSAISQQLSALERDCGTVLFERRSGGVTLTDDGQVVLERAEQLLHHLSETEATIAQLGGTLTGRVRIATISSAAAALVLPTVRLLERTAPAVSVSVSTQEPLASMAAIEDGTADLALIDLYDHVPIALPSHLEAEDVLTEPLVLATAKAVDLPSRPALADLKDRPWVMPPADAACGMATRHACRRAGFEPQIGWETDDLLLLVAAVSRGAGVALLPRRAVADTVAPVDLRTIHGRPLTRRIVIVAKPAVGRRASVNAVREAIHHVCKQQPPQGMQPPASDPNSSMHE